MGRIATFDKKGSHFQRFGLKIFVIVEGSEGAKIGMDCLVWLGWQEENKR